MFSGFRSRWTMPLRVRGGQAVGDRGGDPHGVAPWQRARSACAGAAFRPSSSSMTANGTPSTMASSWIDEDARMRERRDRARFGLEPAPHLGIRRDVVGHDLDGDVAVEPQIAGRDRPRPCRRSPSGATGSRIARGGGRGLGA